MQLEIVEAGSATPDRPPIVLLHGAWHAAWAWENYLPRLAEAGYHARALSLRGHGASEGKIRGSSIGDYWADLTSVIGSFDRHPIVIAHSMGSYVTQRYLQSVEAPAAVLVAPVPSAGVLRATLRFARRHPGAFVKMNATLSLGPAVGTPELAREVLISERVPPDEAEALVARVESESYRAYLDMFLPIRNTKSVATPVLVIAGDADHLFSVDEHEATATAYGSRAVVFPGFGHDLMLEPGWEATADYILSWLEDVLKNPPPGT